MRCSGCGKDIPFGGQVCPHCLRDKSSDQAGHVAGMIGLLIGGFIGNLIAGFGGMIVGGFILAIAFMIPAMGGKKHSAKRPPTVRATAEPSQTPKSLIPDETTCPDCAETIKAAARVCKHCGFRLGADAP